MPIKFEIYRDGARVTSFEPVAAMAVGPESVPITGEVVFKDGYLQLPKSIEQATAVALLWDLGPLGSFHLETTRMPPREKPYNLNVELARFRLMKIVQKQEDWNLFDFPRAEKFQQKFREAQGLLAEALGKLDDAPAAAVLADDALSRAVDLSEQLAQFHGELLLNRRKAGNSFVKHVIGCRVDSTIRNERYRETATSHFDYAVLPIGWKQVQPQESEFQTGPVDEWIELLSRKRVPVIAGPLINLGEGHVPDWMFIWEHDFDTLRELAYEYVQKIVHRYRKAVAIWNVCAGLQTNSSFTLSFEQIIELTRLLVSQVKAILPASRTLITITQPFGESSARRPTAVAPIMYAEMVGQAGINFEAYGLEIEMGVPAPGMFTRDLFQLSSLLDKFSTLGRPVFLTALSVPGRSTPDTNDKSEGKLNPSLAGRWHRPWDPQLQADWIQAVYELALSKPFVESIAWGNLADVNPTLPGGGLLDDMLKPKPAFTKLQDMRTKFHSYQQVRKGGG